MSAPYKVLYRFEYGKTDTPTALELREYEGERWFSVRRVPQGTKGRTLAFFALLDDARVYLKTEILLVLRDDKAADGIIRRDGRTE